MGRIALFVVLIGGGAYFLIRLVAERALGTAVSPALAISLAVLLAVILWTALMWRFADRLGRGRTDAGSAGAPGPVDSERG